jgi:hypothetical protein
MGGQLPPQSLVVSVHKFDGTPDAADFNEKETEGFFIVANTTKNVNDLIV